MKLKRRFCILTMSYLRSDLRQRQILEVAKRVFADRGYHAANISHICQAAGIGRGTLYQYFANKRAVFAAIVHDVLHRAEALMQAPQPATMPPPEALTRDGVVAWSAHRLLELFRAVFADEDLLRILLREAVGLGVDIEQLLSGIDDRLIAIVQRDLETAIAAGIVRPLDARLVATVMVGGVEKLALTALRGPGTVQLEDLAYEVARLHLIGTLSDRVRHERTPP